MPARWLDLLLRIQHTLDQAEADLGTADLNLFYAHLLGTATRRQTRPRPLPRHHPLPTGDPLSARDPTGA